MHPKFSPLAAVLLGAAAAAVSASSIACTLAPANPARIKQMMANEIAHRLGMRSQDIPLSAITQPHLHTPLGLGADCSGLGAYHHTAGFRIAQPAGPSQGPRPRPGPWPGPRPRPDPWPGGPDRQPRPGPDSPWPERNPSRCAYEGVAVVLGYDYSSPVAVHFEQRCR